MGHKIIVCGGNGAGKSTVSRALSAKTGWVFRDAEDYYFPKDDPDYAYAHARTQEEVAKLLKADLAAHEDIIFAAVRGRHSPETEKMFTCAVYVDAPREIRLRRVRERSYRKFGNRMLPGGDLYETETAFFNMVEERPDSYTQEWLRKASLPVIFVDGTLPPEENAEKILREIRERF